MYSEGFGRMFNCEGFQEHRTKEVELKGTTPEVFREFLNIIYPCQRRPTSSFRFHLQHSEFELFFIFISVQNVRGLLELARMYFIPTVTEHCERRLLSATQNDMSVAERLKLADEYGLLQLRVGFILLTIFGP